jgi:MOSC domain-containing protein YiiM
MFSGRLVAICIAPVSGAPMQSVESVELLANGGPAGDRYEKQSTVTLIEQEALAAAGSDYQLEFSHVECRRNLLTSGVPLNHLVGKQFKVGQAILEGIELCEPCSHLERLTGKKVIKALLHRGGLRARVVCGGKIHPGDEIT